MVKKMPTNDDSENPATPETSQTLDFERPGRVLRDKLISSVDDDPRFQRPGPVKRDQIVKGGSKEDRDE